VRGKLREVNYLRGIFFLNQNTVSPKLAHSDINSKKQMVQCLADLMSFSKTDIKSERLHNDRDKNYIIFVDPIS
jgi:hypothetical protein